MPTSFRSGFYGGLIAAILLGLFLIWLWQPERQVYVRGVRINASNPMVRIENRRAIWSGKIMIDGDQSEVMELLEERVNSLATPFELEWHHVSTKPWDWKLVHVSNSTLEIPADFD